MPKAFYFRSRAHTLIGIFLYALCLGLSANAPTNENVNVNANVDWASHGNGHGEQRFSELSAVNDQNVRDLGLAWIYNMGTYRGLEATPIVTNGTIFVSGN